MRLIDADKAIEDIGDNIYTGSKIRRWLKSLPSVQPDVIRCKDCVNYIDHRCVVADHHVAPFSCCQDVFNARRRGEQ